MHFVSLILFILTPADTATAATAAAELPDTVRAVVEAHCVDCHDAETKKGGLDLTALRFDSADAKSYAAWVTVYDRVRDGEMPPPKRKDRRDPAELKAFLAAVADPLATADRARADREGRAILRRLNRYEYENTLRDLLTAPWLQVKDLLPEDGEAHRSNKVGAALDVSHVQMAAYLAAADRALRQVLAAREVKPATVRYWAREQPSFVKRMTFRPVFNTRAERATFPMLGTVAQPDVLDGKAPVTVGPADLAVREQEAFGTVGGTYVGNELQFDQFVAPAAGTYKLRLSAYTFWAGPGKEASPGKEVKWWIPDRKDTSLGRRPEPVTLYSRSKGGVQRRLGTVDVTPDPGVYEVVATLQAGETIRPDAARLFRSRPSNWQNPLATRDGMPGVAFRWLEVDGPLDGAAATPGYQLMFGDLPTKPSAGGVTRPGGGNAAAVEVQPTDPAADADRLLRGFIAAAYRRPPTDAEARRALAVVRSATESGSSFTDAMIAGYSVVLCSPGVVFLEERPGALDAHALAGRLSYFLWNSPPDAELRRVAGDGSLRRPEVLATQAERLLADARSQRFVDAFLDYWLDLRKIDATAPDAALYNDYYLDDLLVESAVDETRAFFAELLRHDLPARDLVAADFAMLNERLADHYQLPPVAGSQLRRVPLPADSVRGGLLTQASVLKVTANGTTTSPVLRGAWVMERVVGMPPPPPPPSVPAVEPDIRGATTIREQLDKHRAVESCAACHTKIDPAGFALESFDVLGGWRDRYRAVSEAGANDAAAKDNIGAKDDIGAKADRPKPVAGFGKNGQPFAFHLGPAVDPSGVLPDGRAFADVRELKRLLAADERQIARNLVRQLVVFSTGAPVRFGDRAEVERILDRAEAASGTAKSGNVDGRFGVRTLVREIVRSSLFQTK